MMVVCIVWCTFILSIVFLAGNSASFQLLIVYAQADSRSSQPAIVAARLWLPALLVGNIDCGNNGAAASGQ